MMKRKLAWRLLIASMTLAVGAQEIRDWRPKEKQIGQAMREEIFRRIEKKSHVENSGETFDFHTNQAFDKIKKLIWSWDEKEGALRILLSGLYSSPTDDPNVLEFQRIVNDFALGWGIELCDTLQAEYDEIYFYLMNLIRFNRDIAARKSLNRPQAVQLLHEYGLSLRLLDPVPNSDDDPGAGGGEEPTYTSLNAIKKGITGTSADKNQYIMFVLGDQYRKEYTFMQDFLEQIRYLAAEHAKIAAETRRLIAAHRIRN